MTETAISGPLIVFRDGGVLPNSSDAQNPVAAPSLVHLGFGLLDPRQPYTYYPGSTQNIGNVKPAIGWINATFQVADYAPGTASTVSLSAAATISSTSLTLVSSNGNGVTTASSVTNPQTGSVVTGLWLIDNIPGNITFGQAAAFGVWDPTNPPIGRAVSITAGTGTLAAQTFTVSGYDSYGNPISSVVTGPTTSSTVYTGKTFKWISSVTCSTASSAVTVSVGVSDIYGLPMFCRAVAYLDMWWNNVPVWNNTTATATFVAGTASITAGATDVRGSINPSNIAVSNGTIKMQLWQSIEPADLVASKLFGTTPPA